MNDEQSRRKVRVDLEELRLAMEDASYEHHYFLDTGTGDVILVSEFLGSGDRKRRVSSPS